MIVCIAVILTMTFGVYSYTPTSAKEVKINRRDAALALTTLDIAISQSDKSSLDESLNEGEIASGIAELHDNFEIL